MAPEKTLCRWLKAGLVLMGMAGCLGSGVARAQDSGTSINSARIDAIVKRMTAEEKVDYIGGTGFAVRAVPGLGLPAWEMSDGPYGARSNAGLPSTTYSAGIGLAASWNRELAARVGHGIGRDARARGVHFMLGPGVNIYRSPRNGRNFEYFGEDPFLASAIAVSYINGMQAEGVSATVKHFLGNNSEFLRHDSDSLIDERTLREIYLPAFEASVRQAHVGAIMDSYNLTNGLHMTQNGYFNTEIARKEWGFQGVMMSDWDATYDGVAAANGGLDLEMPFGKFMNRKTLLPALNNGQLSMATLDEKVKRILSTAERFHWFDRDQHQQDISLIDREASDIALQSARESIVLLKNEGELLPLDKASTKSILVVGPDAYPGVPVGGGSAGVRPFHTVSLLEGIKAVAGDTSNVFYDRGLPTAGEVGSATEFVTEPTAGKPGVKVEFFANSDLTGKPIKTVTSRRIDNHGTTWEEALRDTPDITALFAEGAAHHYSRRWSGYYIAPQAEKYIFVLEGDGENNGNRVYVDGKLVIDNWTLAKAFQPYVVMPLTAGAHKVVVESWQGAPVGGRLQFGIVSQRNVVNNRAKEIAAKTDAVVVAAGFDPGSEGEGADRTFELPFGQEELIRELAAINKKTVVVVTSGGNVASSDWLDKVPAYLEAWYGGQEGGKAQAEVLFGEVNPSGRLPVSFERKAEDNPSFGSYYPAPGSKKVTYKEGIFVGYRGYERNHIKPQFPFGYGLTYTSFRLSNLSVEPVAEGHGLSYKVSLDVTNTGKRDGCEVAQIYVADEHASVPRPPKELKGFEKVQLKPGETKRVSISLDARSFAYYDVAQKKWTIAPGAFRILAGSSSESIALQQSIEISAKAALEAF